MISRRKLLTGLAGLVAGAFVTKQAAAKESAETEDFDDLRFPGDPTDHNVVYQFNKTSQKYHDAVLFSAGEMLRKYGDNVTVVITALGPGIHILAENPTREVSQVNKQKVKSLADYGVKFHACGNTLDSLGWTENDLYDFVEIVQVGAADLLELQEQGYGYISL